jgi:hypothetical protein
MLYTPQTGQEVGFGIEEEKKWCLQWSKAGLVTKNMHGVSINSEQGYADISGYDEYHPDSKSGRQMVPPSGMGWVIVDALDTLMLMNLTTQVAHARDWIRTTLNYRQDHDVNTFETTIRMLGGLLSAHYLQTAYPDLCPLSKSDRDGEDLYLEKAVELAESLVGAFESPTGIPYASVNLKSSEGIPSHADAGSSSLSEATTVQLELKYLSNLTGEVGYWEKAEAAVRAVDDPSSGAEPDGLKGVFVSPETGKFTSNYIRLGSRGDSYYEYLIKQYLQTSAQEPVYLEMWNEALEGIKKHLITYSSPSHFTVLAERPYGVRGKIEPKMDHLVCFFPGTLALAATGGKTVTQMKKAGKWTAQNQEDLELAEELMKTCWSTYKFTRTGLAGEITFFHLPLDDDIKLFYDYASTKDKSKKPRPKGPDVMKHLDEDAEWRQDMMVKPSDAHNLQRPETVESLFMMWRVTGDERYREWGWEMFESFIKHTRGPEDTGFTSISNVNNIPTTSRNNMESFWLVSSSWDSDSANLTRPRLLSISTCSSVRMICSHWIKLCSTLKPMRFLEFNLVACSRRAGRERIETKLVDSRSKRSPSGTMRLPRLHKLKPPPKSQARSTSDWSQCKACI